VLLLLEEFAQRRGIAPNGLFKLQEPIQQMGQLR
jgi:hypothetical protein